MLGTYIAILLLLKMILDFPLEFSSLYISHIKKKTGLTSQLLPILLGLKMA